MWRSWLKKLELPFSESERCSLPGNAHSLGFWRRRNGKGAATSEQVTDLDVWCMQNFAVTSQWRPIWCCRRSRLISVTSPLIQSRQLLHQAAAGACYYGRWCHCKFSGYMADTLPTMPLTHLTFQHRAGSPLHIANFFFFTLFLTILILNAVFPIFHYLPLGETGALRHNFRNISDRPVHR